MAELVGSCIQIHACWGLPNPNCLFDPSGLSLCLPGDLFCTGPVDDVVLFHSMVSDGGLVSYTTLTSSGGSGFGYSRRRMTERRKKNTLQRRSISVATLPVPLTRSNGISWRNHRRAKQRKDRIKEANTKVWLLCHM